ncbi:hypothetical protein J4E85_004630 [Alternaria conjuncta]|uniref:uncharacterized protein n=1 Tax=Alternaria conjuncta TaxID=181017 RepID=UPI00221EFA7D|nr:uncharacterized protein J4E85_004630 [Alternaria conjuncta]KAI4930008.1 hypothetical protein J4E85_004630 [Alternaria conjuncta]
MTWNLACVVNFCFDGKEPQNEKAYKMRRWNELWDLVQTWMHGRPDGFNAIFEGPAGDGGCFPEILFTADWHGPKFAIRNVGSLSETDVRTKVTKQHEHLLIEVESDLDACSRHFRG